jgi:uncharacterized protein YceK
MRLISVLLLVTLALAGCQSKAKKVQELQKQYDAEYPAYSKDCLDEDTAGSSRMLTGEKLTEEEMATLADRKKARDERCKPQADHLADIQRQILAAQQ